MEGIMFRFLSFPVYQLAKKWYVEISELCEKINCSIEIKNQLLRAALSVSLNIAEGSAKNSDKDFARFLYISIGSVHESIACLDILAEQKNISAHQYQTCITNATSLSRQLGGFVKHLYNSKK